MKRSEIGNWKLEIPRLGGGGFTLIELLVYMGIFSILLLVMTQVFTSVLETQLESQSLSSVQTSGRFILTRLMYDINSAQSIATPSAIGSGGSTLQILVNGIPYTYEASSGNVTLNDTVGTIALNNYNTTVSNLSFQRLGNANGKNTIKIIFTLSSKVALAGGVESKTFSTVVGIR